MRVAGLVLAAGAGSRYGGPKGLARDGDGTPWVRRAVRMLRTSGCATVWVAVGAEADAVAELVPPDAHIVRVDDWATGLAATLRAGLAAASADPHVDAIAVTPVDTPDAPPAAVARVLAGLPGDPRAGLAQATYGGAPGHPVVIGAGHVGALIASLAGDRGARAYLVANGVVEIECADLWTGADVDS